jgi:hypothetical protein
MSYWSLQCRKGSASWHTDSGRDCSCMRSPNKISPMIYWRKLRVIGCYVVGESASGFWRMNHSVAFCDTDAAVWHTGTLIIIFIHWELRHESA